MVSLIEVKRFLESEFPDITFYPLEYPLNSPVNSVMIDMNANVEANVGLFPLNIQLKVRDTHPSKAELTSFELREKLENKTNFMIGGVQVVLVKSQNPVPLYMGKDTNSNYLYSNNFRFLMNEE